MVDEERAGQNLDSRQLRRRLGEQRLEVLDRNARGAFDDRWWGFGSQHYEQAQDRGCEEVCLLPWIDRATEHALTVRVAQRRGERP